MTVTGTAWCQNPYLCPDLISYTLIQLTNPKLAVRNMIGKDTFPPLCKWPFSDSELQKEDCDFSFQLGSKLHAELGILYLLLKHVCSGLNCLSLLSSFSDAKSMLRTFYVMTAPLSFCQFLSNYIH